MLQTVHLRTLVEVMRCGSFATAARRLGYTGAAVSQHIKALEAELGVELFERSAQRVRPTSAAKALTPRCRELLMGLDEVVGEARALAAGGHGQIHIGAFHTACTRILPPALATLRASYPEVSLLLTLDDSLRLITQVADGEMDVAVVYEYDSVPYEWPDEINREPVCSEPSYLLVPAGHRAASAPPGTFAGLAGEQWISLNPHSPSADAFVRYCGLAGFVPDVIARASDYNAIVNLVGSALGLAVVPAYGYVRHRDVCALEMPADFPHRNSYLIRRTAHRTVLTDALATALRGPGSRRLRGPRVSCARHDWQVR